MVLLRDFEIVSWIFSRFIRFIYSYEGWLFRFRLRFWLMLVCAGADIVLDGYFMDRYESRRLDRLLAMPIF